MIVDDVMRNEMMHNKRAEALGVGECMLSAQSPQ